MEAGVGGEGVDLLRPLVAHAERLQLHAAVAEDQRLAEEGLGRAVVTVQAYADRLLGHRPHLDLLFVAVELGRIGDEGLDDERAAGCQDAGDVAEAILLPAGDGQVEQGVEDQVDERVAAVDRHVGHVGDGHRQVGAARLGAQQVDHLG